MQFKDLHSDWRKNRVLGGLAYLIGWAAGMGLCLMFVLALFC